MINILDKVLQEREENPIRVGVVGAGRMARPVSLQLLTPVPGIRLVALANRSIQHAKSLLRELGCTNIVEASSASEVSDAIMNGQMAVTGNYEDLCKSSDIDVLVEITGAVEFGAHVVTLAIDNGKHVILINAELDSTLGPILKQRADRAGVVITNVDGDEPGVAMNLMRYLKSIGLKPVAAGNLKGMIDHYRNPETQREFAAKYDQNPSIVTSFADGTKLSMELAILANATGFRVSKRGMLGPRCAHVKEMATKLPSSQLLSGGLVDYALGAEPGTGAFVVVHEDNPRKMSYLSYLKMGDGPFYVFYTPYHLPHIQVASSIGSAAILKEATVAPRGAPVCHVFATAKKDLQAGEALDGVGGFSTYGVIDNTTAVLRERLLPMGLSHDCTLNKDIKKDHAISLDDVDVPKGRLIEKLWEEQQAAFT